MLNSFRMAIISLAHNCSLCSCLLLPFSTFCLPCRPLLVPCGSLFPSLSPPSGPWALHCAPQGSPRTNSVPNSSSFCSLFFCLFLRFTSLVAPLSPLAVPLCSFLSLFVYRNPYPPSPRFPFTVFRAAGGGPLCGLNKGNKLGQGEPSVERARACAYRDGP